MIKSENLMLVIVVSPFQQALLAGFAPEQMRGRYMAVSGLSWGIAFAIGPYFAGLILDSAHPNLLWAMCGLLGVLASVGFTVLNRIHHSDELMPEAAAAD
jgi:MFS family permease